MEHVPLPIDEKVRRGRAATTNTSSRYEPFLRERSADGWHPVAENVLRTHVRDEQARSLITYNRSPDLPFDRSINPYRGCEHGCIYCFARPSHAYLGLSPGLDFETQLIARPNAPDVLARELARPSYQVAPIAIGTNTDPYQPIEKDREIMRRCLEVLLAARHPVAIVTKGALIERDIDLLARFAQLGLVRVGISVTTLDPALSRRMEPRAPSPARRLDTIKRLSAACIPVRVMASPIIPGLTDCEVEAILEAGAQAGAQTASWIMLRLPREVSELWQAWLHENYPNHLRKVMGHLREMHGGKDYDARWGRRMRGTGPYAGIIAKRFDRAARAVGLETHAAPLRCDLFAPPRAVRRSLTSPSTAQLSLF